MRRLVPVAAVLAGLMIPSVAIAKTTTVHSGQVTASLTYRTGQPFKVAQKLTISQAGHVVYNEPVRSSICGSLCALTFIDGQRPLQLADVEQNDRPEVLLSLYSGGAHCCSILQVFTYLPGTGHYRISKHNFGDPGYRVEQLRLNSASHPQFVTGDDSFAYAFTDFAASGLPVQVLDLLHGQFQKVTVDYPTLIAKDAARWLKVFHSMAGSHYSDSTGVIAAWAADEDNLGHLKRVSRYLAQQARAGHLNSALAPGEPEGLTFVAKLKRFLKAHGYGVRQLAAQ